MKSKYKQHLPVLLYLAVIIVLAVVLFACETSKNQDIQITNVFTPGSTRAGENQTQIPASTTNPTESAQATAEATLLPSALPTMIVTNAQGQPVFVTQTRPASQPNQPTSTRTATQPNQSTSTQTATQPIQPTSTRTATQPNQPTSPNPATNTPSPTPQTGWAGEWTAYLEQANGSFLDGTLTITLGGEVFSAEFNAQGSRLNLDGFLQEGGAHARGDYSGFSGVGYFYLFGGPAGTFVGNLDNRLAFCAARHGFAQPDPCGYFFPR